jgi:hypothetical protein
MTFAIDASFALNVVQDSVRTLVASLVEVDPDDGDHVVPGELRRAFARLRLLEGVPFSYLVANAALLPPESIRFFYLDRAWTDALVLGALSPGTITTADRAQLETLYPRIRDEVDEAERVIRRPEGEERLAGPAGTVTGFLLRSRAVSGWPGLHVRAYHHDRHGDSEIIPESDPDRLKVLRMERLAPAVLLVLFDGSPAVVQIEEPRQGIQFGARLRVGPAPGQSTAIVKLRDATTGTVLGDETDLDDPATTVVVPFRPNAPGVVNLRALRTRMLSHPNAKLGPAVEANEFALEMLRFPYRQVFGDPQDPPAPLSDLFRVTVSFAALETRFTAVLNQ